ncbi:zinc-ribbon domain-containing protein [Parvibaculum sp.]|uniref:zinc-ribbon domain-containing protein n=1 Tax=Parvibaculum sp. TaxID=2024848 RepID=UPI002B7F6D45|nr:MJ0042-type zinc finger domain-containing protein [Parvibaculum sp.]HUD52927.1 MJ0042-type zinc finger domain-containing protein [Parvibaculum sp.]
MIITCPACSTRYPVDAASFAPSGRKVRCAKCGHSWHQAPPTDLPRKDEPTEEEAAAVPPELEEQPEEQPVPTMPFDAPATPIFKKKAAPAEEETAQDEEDSDIVFAEPGASASGASQIGASQLGNGGKLRHFVNHAASSRRGRVLTAIGWVLLLAFVSSTLFGAWHFRKDIASLWPATTKLYAAVDEPMNLRGLEFRQVSYERQMENGLPVLAVKGEVVNVSGETRTPPRLRVGLLDTDRHELYHWTFALAEKALDPKQSVPFTTRLSSPPAGARDIELRFVLKGEENEPASAPVAAPPS